VTLSAGLRNKLTILDIATIRKVIADLEIN
jgi:hypothetical protein